MSNIYKTIESLEDIIKRLFPGVSDGEFHLERKLEDESTVIILKSTDIDDLKVAADNYINIKKAFRKCSRSRNIEGATHKLYSDINKILNHHKRDRR